MTIPKIIGNWKVVLLSFLGATIFWFFSALGKDYNYRVQIPITFLYDRDSLVAVSPLPEYVDLDVSGGGWELFRESFWFGSDPIIFELDNPATIKYLTRATILPMITNQLGQYRINFLFTDTLYLDIDRKISKKVRIKVDSSALAMDEEHRLISPIRLSPDSATIFGPSSFVDTLNETYVMTLRARGIDKSFERDLQLGLPDGWDIYSTPPTVKVAFDVDQFDEMRLVTPVETQNFPKDSSAIIADPNITVRFVVQRARKETYAAEDFKVIVDYRLMSPSDSTCPAIVVFQPEEVIEVETLPDSVAIIYVK